MIPVGLGLGLKAFLGGAWAALTSPVVWVSLGALALVASHGLAYREGAASEAARCDAAALRTRVAALERDLQVAAAAAASSEEKTSELEGIAAAAQKQVADYVAELARRDNAGPGPPPGADARPPAPPVDVCRIDPTDGRRLRGIR